MHRLPAAAAALLLTTAVVVGGAGAAEAAPAALHVDGTRHLAGTSGALDYDVVVPVFRGGAAAVVNARVIASVRDTIAATAAEDPTTAHHTLDGRGTLTALDDRTVQVLLGYDDYYDGAAHPTDTVTTLALTVSGAPITLAKVFPHETKAFRVLAKAVRRLATKAHEPITEPAGLKPVEKNWSAWQATGRGFQVSFQDYQLGGHGVRQYTVPWSTVIPLLSKRAIALFNARD